MSKLLVIGCGAWGATIAKILSENGNDVTIWCHDDSIADQLNEKHNLDLLPNCAFPDALVATTDLSSALADVDGIVIGVASQFLPIVESIQTELTREVPVMSLTKGLLADSDHLFVSQYLRSVFGGLYPLVFLSGPNLATEIADAKPAATVIASHDESASKQFQDWLNSPYFRVYTQTDVMGVELGGVLKNVYAIAAGIMDGFELGDNAKSAMVTRALQEMIRFGVSFGASKETFFGLSGLGDLMATCSSPTSRNWRVGAALAEHGNLEKAIESLGSISEGVKTAKLMYTIAQEKQLDLPIAKEVYDILYADKPPKEALQNLMSRPPKPE